MRIASAHDRSGNAMRTGLFAVLRNDACELSRFNRREPLRQRVPRFVIHAHVERTIGRKAKPSFWRIELWRRHAEIKQHAGKCTTFEPWLDVLAETLEAPMANRETRVDAKSLRRIGNGLRIFVDRKQPPGSAELRQNPCAMPPASIRCIDVTAIT